MSLKKLFLVSYSIIVAGVIVIGLLVLWMSHDHRLLRQKQELRYQSYLLADQLRQSSDDLTRMARTYVVTGDPRYEQMYGDILAIRNGEQPRPAHYERIYWDLVLNTGDQPRTEGPQVSLQKLMQDAGFTDEEFAKLREAQANSDALVATERIAMNAVKGLFADASGKFVKRGTPDLELARLRMHDQDYHRHKAAIMRPIDDFFVLLDQRTGTAVDRYARRASVVLVVTQLLTCALVALTLAIAAVVSRNIWRQVGGEPSAVVQAVQGLAEGDLLLDEQRTDGEALGILGAMQRTAQRLRQVVGEVHRTASHLASSSLAIKNNSWQMSQGAATQARAAVQAAQSVEGMAGKIRQNTENALETERLAVRAASDADASGQAVTAAVAAIQQIAGKIKVIEDITRQTRILSLNAAIEAAKAREHGTGFAVVASEVRTLAESCRVAANEINALANSSVTTVERAGSMLKKLIPDIQHTAFLVQQITAATRAEDAEAAEIQRALRELDQVTQQNTATAEGVAAVAERLAAQANDLQGAVAFFRLHDAVASA